MSFSLSGSIITQTGTDTNLSGLTGLTGVTTTSYSQQTEYKLTNLTLIVEGTITQTNNERLTFLGGDTNAIVIESGGEYNFGAETTFTTNAGDSVTVRSGMHSIDIGKPIGRPYIDSERGLITRSGGTFNVYGGVINTHKAIRIEAGATFLVRDGHFAFSSTLTYQNFYIIATDVDIINMKVVDNNTIPTLNVGIQANYTRFEGFSPSGTNRAIAIIDPMNVGIVKVEKYQGGGKNIMDVRLRTQSFQSRYYLYEAPIGNDLRVEGFAGAQQSKGHARHYIRYNPTFKDSVTKAGLADVKIDMIDTNNGSRRTGLNPEQSPNDLSYTDTSNSTGVLPTAPIEVLTAVWHNDGNNNRQVFVLDDRLPVLGNCMQYLYNLSSLSLADSKVGQDSADVLLVEDTTLTETNKTTVDAYTEIGDAFKAYDRAKSYLYDNFAGEGSTIIGRSGDNIAAGSNTIILDPTASGVFSLSGTDATIKSASTFTSGSDGSVVAKNGVALDGGTFNDLEYQNASTTVDNLEVTGSMEMTTAGTYTFNNCTINEINNTSGSAITIVSNGTTITSTIGDTVNIQSPLTVVNFNDLIAGSQVVVYSSGTTTELFRVNSSSTSEQFTSTSTSVSYDYTVQKPGYFPLRSTSLNSTNVSATNIGVLQILDRAYVASSVLTNANVTIDISAKTIDITTATTVQNAYSYFIEAFINESSLRNVSFPVTTFGSASFSLDQDYEFTAGTISNLSRDGFRYTNAGNIKAIYLAILSQGVTAGLQPEYVQEQGGSVSDAIVTGNVDQVIKIFGDTNNGNFDYRDHLILKVQANGYRPVEFDVPATYGTLEASLYVVALITNPIEGLTLGDPSVSGITLTDNTASPVSWDAGDGAKDYSFTITDTGSNTGEDILRHFNYLFSTDGTLNSKDVFQYPELVIDNGAALETIRGTFRPTTGNSVVGIRVIDGSGNAHPAFTRFQSDDGSYGTVPILATATVTNITSGSRLQVYNVTTATEILNTIVNSTSYVNDYADGTGYSDGDSIRVRLTQKSTTTAKLGFESTTLASSAGWAVVATQKADDVYNAIAVDGANITIFEADYIDTEIDLIVSQNFGSEELYPWWVNNLITADGIRYFFNGLVAEDRANFKIDSATVDIMFDTDVSTNVYQNNDARIYRSDGIYPVKAPTTGGGAIDLVWRQRVFIAQTGISGLTPAESTLLNGISNLPSASDVRTEIDSNSTQLTSIKTTVEDTNVDVNAIPTAPTVEQIRTEIDSNSTQLTSIKTTVEDTNVDVNAIPTAPTVEQIRTEIDSNSTQLTSIKSTAEDTNADVNAIVIPTAPTVEQIRTEIDSNSTQLALIKDTIEDVETDIANIPTAPTPPTVEEIRTEIDDNSTKLEAVNKVTKLIPATL